MHWIKLYSLHLDGLLHANIVGRHDDYGLGLGHLMDAIWLELGGLQHWGILNHMRLGAHSRNLDELGLLGELDHLDWLSHGLLLRHIDKFG